MDAKTKILKTVALVTGIIWTNTIAQAGSLTPPGAPDSTMYTLEEIHARAAAAETYGIYAGSDCLIGNCLLFNCTTYGIKSSTAGRVEVRDCRILNTTSPTTNAGST